MITVSFERKIADSVKRRIRAVCRRHKTLEPLLVQDLEQELGRRYSVYKGDNHIAIHPLYWQWADIDVELLTEIGKRSAILTDGISL